VKWLILAVVVILVAPTLANRLQELNPENADNPDNPRRTTTRKRRGVVYRSVRRFGPRRVFVAFVLILAILAVVAYLLVRRI
jgi:hypothetical protein